MQADELTAMIARDETHWWYRGRRRVLAAALDGLELPDDPRLLDAGCGSGRTLDDLAARGRVAGADLSPLAVAAARARGHADVHVAPVEALPFADGSFDLVTCLDVVEHTPDDRATLAELLRVTRPRGALVVTVPAYQSLWSAHDLANAHFRRYVAPQLRAVAVEAGWRPESDTYFNALLLGPAALVRLARRRAARSGARSELSLTPRSLDRVLETPLRLEARLIAAGRRLPAGLSLLAVLRRPATPRAARAPSRPATTRPSSAPASMTAGAGPTARRASPAARAETRRRGDELRSIPSRGPDRARGWDRSPQG